MEEKKLKFGVLTVILIVLVILCMVGIIIYTSGDKNKTQQNTNITETEPKPLASDDNTSTKQTEGVTVVPTMLDTITADSTWCGTFQLVWNDMKKEVVKKDVVFTPQLDMVVNLNKEDFNESIISEDYYFKIYGLKTLELKEKIEKGIKEKFNQTSDILEDFDWSDSELDNPNNLDTRRYFFYTMLYRKFEFLKEFNKLENGKFGSKYDDVKYFGIDNSTKNSVRAQIEVLYYNSKDDFALLINTKTNDEVIFCKSPKGNTFNEIYTNMNNEANKFTGSKSFEEVDEFKAPNLSFNEKREYKELENKEFMTADNNTAEIEKAIQTVKFSLDEKGGEIKSEAAIDIRLDSMAIPEKEEPRYFYVDDTFAIFLREKGKTKPYFAGKVDDITKFQ